MIRKIITAFFMIFCLHLSLWSQQKEMPVRPKLVVSIVIDGLREDRLVSIWEYLDKGGLRRIMEQGFVNKNVSFPYVCSGSAADYASIYSGTFPSYHGITSDVYFDTKTEQKYSSVYDPAVKGIGNTAKASPRNLLVSTFVDELKLATRGKSKVITVALNESEAIMMAGHAGNTTVWMDNKTGAWVSSDYYAESLPSWAVRINTDGTLNAYMQRNWSNYYIDFYYSSPSVQNGNLPSFSYSMSSLVGKNPSFELFKNTPWANSMVRELAINAIKDEYIGIDDIPDVLNLQFSVRGFDALTTGVINAETQDLYIRLDKDIRLLLDFLDLQFGISNVLVSVTSGQVERVSPVVLQTYKIPSGYFMHERSISLLSTYLMAVYGQARWVLGYADKQIYLNHEVIKEKKLNIEEVQQKVADFMSQFSGVQSALTATELAKHSGDGFFMKYKNGYHKNLSGDVLLFLQPGWVEVANEKQTVGASANMSKKVPFMLYGWRIKPQVKFDNIFITDIAPTLCNLLQLNYPNACIGKAVLEITE
jgi:hypothetical protein